MSDKFVKVESVVEELNMILKDINIFWDIGSIHYETFECISEAIKIKLKSYE